jgi:histone deacetylase HOS2
VPAEGNDPQPYNIGDDCPIFEGLYQYAALYAGASLDAARKLTSHQSQIAINWSGGLHHAKKSEASGFCYINDIVLAILQLLLHHPRVLYIDIDVHHGDGVEQAFWSTDRVMTLSFHKYDKESYFPGTGPLDSTGPANPSNPGAHHSLNVPLNDGIEDDQYIRLFQDIVGPCVSIYRPTAIVLQCGADSLGGDRLGCFNLGIKAHGACVDYTKSFNIPLLVLGGGGYTPANVARCWAYETSVCISAQVHDKLPAHTPLIEHFHPYKTLFPPLGEFKKYNNLNTKGYLAGLVVGIREQLRYVQGSPSVQMQHIPPDLGAVREEVDAEIREEKEREEEFRKRKERGRGVRGELY